MYIYIYVYIYVYIYIFHSFGVSIFNGRRYSSGIPTNKNNCICQESTQRIKKIII